MSLRSRDTDALLAVLADPKLHQERLSELREAEARLAAKFEQFEEREKALASRERTADGIIASQGGVQQTLDRREAVLKTREQACESHESAVAQKAQEANTKINAADEREKLTSQRIEAVYEREQKVAAIERDLEEKLSLVAHERAVLAGKREQVLKIMS